MARDGVAICWNPAEAETIAGDPPLIHFRFGATDEDVHAVEALVRSTGVFSEAEIGIACDLVKEAVAKGEATSGYHFVFAEGHGELEGYACFGPIPGTDRRYELFWIAVRDRARGSGLSAELLRICEAKTRSMGGIMLVAETSTRPDYAAAHKFYVARGFTLLAKIADWHADGDGLAIFGKRLR